MASAPLLGYSEQDDPREDRACTVVLCLAVLFKFWLIAEMEITDDPDDSPNYIAQILGAGPSFFGPGTGYVGKLFYGLGIPFRDGIEFLYLLASLLAVRALFKWPTHSYLSLGLFLFVYFNPAPEELFSHMMADQVWLVEALLGLSLFVLFVTNPGRWRWLYLVPAVGCLGLSTVTRMMFTPLMASFAFWAVLAVGAALFCVTYWKRIPAFTTAFLAQQFFAIFYVTFFFLVRALCCVRTRGEWPVHGFPKHHVASPDGLLFPAGLRNHACARSPTRDGDVMNAPVTSTDRRPSCP